MKKILILTLLLIISFTSMNFRGCNEYLIFIDAVVAHAYGDYRYGDEPLGIRYSIYVGEDGKIWRATGDYDISYVPVTSPTTQRLNSVRISPHDSYNSLIAVGNNGAIIHSNNTGTSWSLDQPVTSNNLYGIDFNGSSYVYVVGDNGTILYDAYVGGFTWEVRNSGTTRNLKAVHVSTQTLSTVVAVGDKGTIVRTTNGGITWLNAGIADTTFNFTDISQKDVYTNQDVYCAVGTGGRIYKSTNLGATWTQKPSGTTNNLRKIYFQGADSGVVVGDNGTIRLTTNGGETWFTNSILNSPPSRNYKSVSIISPVSKAYSAMSDSIFYISEEPIVVGINNTTATLPSKFSLQQNFPNPFNPSTKIKFDVPSEGNSRDRFVLLKVFDVTGREAAVLVNQNMQPGSHEVEFDGSKLSSGVYFYRIEAGEFTDTKKMLMIK